ncbi:unnamed protein product, partial [marine sediment metagenome]
GTGGIATATAGPGGDLREWIPAQVGPGIGVTLTAYLGTAGDGGAAYALGGDGGPYGGAGGPATATGGPGGNARYPEHLLDWVISPSEGGIGGRAQATGGQGRDGVSCCDPPEQAQGGGVGGDATAKGGKGGDGWFPRKGGKVFARGGDGGRGGDGKTDTNGVAGLGGTEGAASVTPGPTGVGIITIAAGVGTVEKNQNGARGVDGGPCPVDDGTGTSDDDGTGTTGDDDGDDGDVF